MSSAPAWATRWKLGSIAVLLGLAAALLLASPASAERNPIAKGSTTLYLNGPTASALAANGVNVAPIRPAGARGAGIAFPVTGGRIDPSNATGRIAHSGGLRFSGGGSALATGRFLVGIGQRSAVLNASVGGARVNLLRLDTERAKIARRGPGMIVRGVQASLTGAAADALNATFGVHLFRPGMTIGRVVTMVWPESVALADRGGTRLTLDPGTAEALTSLGVMAGPVDPARATRAGALVFPITGGRLNTSSLAGRIGHSGGISLTAGETRVDLTRFRIGIGESPGLTAIVGSDRVRILDLDLAAIRAGIDGRRISIDNVGATLTAEAAAALNAAFGVTAFSEGLMLGTADVRAVAR